jgi:sec-independent protein translocase protein TatA
MLAAFLGGWEWLVLLFAVLLLFGSRRIPELARGLGQSIKEFKKGAREVTEEIQNAGEENHKSASPNKPAANGPPPGQTVPQSSHQPKA